MPDERIRVISIIHSILWIINSVKMLKKEWIKFIHSFYTQNKIFLRECCEQHFFKVPSKTVVFGKYSHFQQP